MSPSAPGGDGAPNVPATPPEPDDRAWLAGQVARFQAQVPRYEVYAEVLDAVLRRAVGRLAPLAIVQVRRKSLASFAEKCLRKRAKRPDPAAQFTDLCGARVIARTRSEVDAVCRWVVANLEVDWEDSLDAGERLRPSEFGYRSVHYIVSLRPDVDYGVPVPPEALGLRAEIQARTLTEHAYSDFAHDLTYKGAFDLPPAWQRELAGAAAVLEEVDGVFDRVERGLREYASTYGRYLTEAELAAETERLEIVLAHDPGNTALAGRLGRLGMVRGDWPGVVRVLTPVVDAPAGDAPSSAVRDLGEALCRLNGAEPYGAGFRAGLDLLERAGADDDVPALCALAEAWQHLDADRALEVYRRAFDLDPADAHALGGYLELQLPREPGLVDSLRPVLRQSAERSRHQVTARVNLPGALFHLAQVHLLLGEGDEALGALAEAVALSHADWMLEAALASLDRLTRSLHDRAGADRARRLLLLALARHDVDGAPGGARVRLQALATPGAAPLRPPVLIVAGGTDPSVEERMATYRDLLRSALADFRGTVLSGGTTQGVCGIVGDLGRERGGDLHTVGYLPLLLPADATRDDDYHEIRRTDGHSFSATEPLQNWTDLIAAGIAPSSVTVLGVGGGRIAALEYRIALALGAAVGLVEESGREAGRLLGEQRWAGPRPVRLPADAETLRAFVVTPSAPLPDEVRERVARSIHEAYRRERMKSPPPSDPALTEWSELTADLRASNLAQADAVAAKVARVGCAVVPVEAPGEPALFTADEVEMLAEAEHGRWVAERLLAGWTLGEVRDAYRRTSPYIVSWAVLPECVRARDREAVLAIPDRLAEVGLGLRRAAGAG